MFSWAFCDFGPEFEVVDSTGEEPKEFFIWNISKVCEGHLLVCEPFTEKEVFFFMSCMWDKEKILSSSHEELNLRPLDSSLRCSNIFREIGHL